MQRDPKLQKIALERKEEFDTYQSMAADLGGSPALWWSICEKGKASPKARRLLGMPLEPVEVPPCVECGKVHTLKHCNQTRSKKRRRVVGSDVPADFNKEETALLRNMHLAYSHVAVSQIREMRA